MHLSVMVDRTTTIRASIRDVERTLVISIGLVILVVFVFLETHGQHSSPASLSLCRSSELSAIMYLLGYSLDNLSLMALTISTGFVVDDAIVVIENIARYLEARHEAVRGGAAGLTEIGFTVLSMTTSLIAVFIPILLMGGIVGRLFREFAVTLSVALVVSLAISLTTTPMLSARFLSHDPEQKHGRLYNLGERFFTWILDTYASALRVVLNHPAITLLILLVTIGVNVYLFTIVPKGFFPLQDTGRMMGIIQGEQTFRSRRCMRKSGLRTSCSIRSGCGQCCRLHGRRRRHQHWPHVRIPQRSR